MSLKTFTIADIRSWSPCYDPSRYLPEHWQGTALDILKHPEIPSQDKLWVVLREGLIDDKTLRLFAAWCARQVEHLLTDERSKSAIDVAERYAYGEATKEELAAEAAARAAAWAAARAAARAAVGAVARDAAWAAAARGARAAGDAVWAAVWDAQVAKLIEMLERDVA